MCDSVISQRQVVVWIVISAIWVRINVFGSSLPEIYVSECDAHFSQNTPYKYIVINLPSDFVRKSHIIFVKNNSRVR
jgi:hypothetical protein